MKGFNDIWMKDIHFVDKKNASYDTFSLDPSPDVPICPPVDNCCFCSTTTMLVLCITAVWISGDIDALHQLFVVVVVWRCLPSRSALIPFGEQLSLLLLLLFTDYWFADYLVYIYMYTYVYVLFLFFYIYIYILFFCFCFLFFLLRVKGAEGISVITIVYYIVHHAHTYRLYNYCLLYSTSCTYLSFI